MLVFDQTCTNFRGFNDIPQRITLAWKAARYVAEKAYLRLRYSSTTFISQSENDRILRIMAAFAVPPGYEGYQDVKNTFQQRLLEISQMDVEQMPTIYCGTPTALSKASLQEKAGKWVAYTRLRVDGENHPVIDPATDMPETYSQWAYHPRLDPIRPVWMPPDWEGRWTEGTVMIYEPGPDFRALILCGRSISSPAILPLTFKDRAQDFMLLGKGKDFGEDSIGYYDYALIVSLLHELHHILFFPTSGDLILLEPIEIGRGDLSMAYGYVGVTQLASEVMAAGVGEIRHLWMNADTITQVALALYLFGSDWSGYWAQEIPGGPDLHVPGDTAKSPPFEDFV